MNKNSLKRLQTRHGPHCSCNSPRPTVTNLVPSKTARIRKTAQCNTTNSVANSKTHFSVLRRGWPRRLSLIDRAPVSPMSQSSKLSYQTGKATTREGMTERGGEGSGK
jgi:hypothetical protein